MSSVKVTVIDYGVGNLLSVQRGLENVVQRLQFLLTQRLFLILRKSYFLELVHSQMV